MTLLNLYKHLFLNKFGKKDDGTWFAALSDLTPKAIENGINALMRMDAGSKYCEYPPSALEFRALCLSYYKELGLPTAEQAFREIETNTRISKPRYSHAAVRYVDYMLGENFFNSDDLNGMYTIFKSHYNKVCHYIKQGHQLPDVPVFVRNKPKTISATGDNAIYNIKKYLGVR